MAAAGVSTAVKVWPAVKNLFLRSLQSGELETALQQKVTETAKTFIGAVTNVENGLFSEYQNSSLALTHGQSAQMVVSAILHHVRQTLVKEPLSVIVIRKVININALAASPTVGYYISLLLEFESILQTHALHLDEQIKMLENFSEAIQSVKKSILDHQGAIKSADKIKVLQALKEIGAELTFHIEKSKIVERNSISWRTIQRLAHQHEQLADTVSAPHAARSLSG